MRTTVHLAGMTSRHAVAAVFTSLTGVEGIRHADVGLNRVVIDHDGRATPDALRAAIADSGYEVTAVDEERRRLV